MTPLRPRDASPSECYAVQCFAHGACVLYVDLYADGGLAALHGTPGNPQPTHAQRWEAESTRAARRTRLLGDFLRYIHPELAQDPRELPASAIAPVTAAPLAAWLAERRN